MEFKKIAPWILNAFVLIYLFLQICYCSNDIDHLKDSESMIWDVKKELMAMNLERSLIERLRKEGGK